MIKKILSGILVVVMAGSLMACGKANNAAKNDTATKQEETTKTETSEQPKEEVKEEIKFETLVQMLDSISEKDYYYSDAGTIKILKKAALKTYQDKAAVITSKAMVDNKIDAKSAKVYNYYNNIDGVKFEKDYVVVYDANKVPTTVYEVVITISDKDEPTLKEVKENKEMINDEFKALFPADLEAKEEAK